MADGAFDVTLSITQAPHRTLDVYDNVIVEESRTTSFNLTFNLDWISARGWSVEEVGVKPT
jgi:hypothetical protein